MYPSMQWAGCVCVHPQAYTPPGRDPPRHTPLPGQTPPPEMATEAGGTHANGMCSCCTFFDQRGKDKTIIFLT